MAAYPELPARTETATISTKQADPEGRSSGPTQFADRNKQASSMSRSAQPYTADWNATDAELVRATADLEAHAVKLGLSHRNALTLVLMLEELYTNTLRYGRGEGNVLESSLPSRTRIRVQLELLPNGNAVLTYEDDAPPYDPFKHLHEQQAAATGLAIEDRPIGKLGAVLLAHLSDKASYAYQEGRNQVRLQLNPNRRTES